MQWCFGHKEDSEYGEEKPEQLKKQPLETLLKG